MRLRYIKFLAGSLFALSMVTPGGCSCGDNLDAEVDGATIDAAAVDAAIDAAFCDSREPGTVGGTCATDEGCALPGDPGAGRAAFCLTDIVSAGWPMEGWCSATCTTNADCGDDSVCGALPDGNGGTFGFCAPTCCAEVSEGQACETGRLCTTSLFGDDIAATACVPGTPGIADGAPCQTFGDCDVNSVCRNDPFQFPNGSCTTLKCVTDADCASAGDGRCVDFQDGVDPVCVDACNTNADCREADGYRCIDRGGTIGKYCQHPAPGDACTVDADCGVNGQGWSCRTGAAYPNGYCTVAACDVADNLTCPIFSFCVDIQGEADNFCADECVTPGSTECGTGYDCVTVQPPGSTGPVNVCVPSGSIIDAPPPPAIQQQ